MNQWALAAKAEKVYKSCETVKQCNVAQRWVSLAKNAASDVEVKRSLERFYNMLDHKWEALLRIDITMLEAKYKASIKETT